VWFSLLPLHTNPGDRTAADHSLIPHRLGIPPLVGGKKINNDMSLSPSCRIPQPSPGLALLLPHRPVLE